MFDISGLGTSACNISMLSANKANESAWIVSLTFLTRAWPGSQPNAIDRGGGGRITPPQANSQTNDRSETGEAALERSRRDGSKALLKFFLKGHVSGQGQVKGKNWAFQHFGSQNRQLDSNRPKLGRNTLKG